MNSLGLVTNGYIVIDRVIIKESEFTILYGKLGGILMKHYVGEIGKVLIVDTSLDVSAATVTKIMIKKPDESVLERDATIYTISGVSNYLKYITVAEDLSLPGLYEVQAKVVVGSATLFGATDRFEVSEIFD